MFHLSFRNQCFFPNRKLFQNGRRIIRISPVRHRVSGKPACPPAESPCLKSLCPGKQLCSAMAAGENALTCAHCSADLLFDKTLTKLPWPEMAHTRKVWGTQQNLEWMAAALLMRCRPPRMLVPILDLKWIQSVCDLYPMYVYVYLPVQGMFRLRSKNSKNLFHE